MPHKPFSGATVLITGGAGMIGSTLAHHALAQGAQVRIVDAMLPLYGGNLFNLEPVSKSIEFIEGDIRDETLMQRLIAGVDYIFDLAAQVSYVDSNRDPLLDLDINCRGHLTLLEACRQSQSQAKIIFSSSRFVYGATKYIPVDENHPTRCTSIYGIHKLNVDKYLDFYHAAFDLNTASVRIANPYGPRQQMKHGAYGIVNWFIRLAMDGQPLTVYGEGRQIRDYVFVDDVVEALLALALAPNTAGKVYNLGSGAGTQFCDMVGMIADLIPGTEIRRVPWPENRYFMESGDYISDITKLRAATGWSPARSLRDGIRETISFYSRHKERYWNASVLAAKA